MGSTRSIYRGKPEFDQRTEIGDLLKPLPSSVRIWVCFACNMCGDFQEVFEITCEEIEGFFGFFGSD